MRAKAEMKIPSKEKARVEYREPTHDLRLLLACIDCAHSVAHYR